MFRESPECFLILPHSETADSIQPLIRDVIHEQGVAGNFSRHHLFTGFAGRNLHESN